MIDCNNNFKKDYLSEKIITMYIDKYGTDIILDIFKFNQMTYFYKFYNILLYK